MSAKTATLYVQKMVKIEKVRSGSQELALKQLSTDYKLGVSQLTHLFKGRAKTCDVSLYARIKLAYLDRCGKMVATLQHEIAIEKALGSDDNFEDLEAEASVLAAKVSQKRTALRQGREVK